MVCHYFLKNFLFKVLYTKFEVLSRLKHCAYLLSPCHLFNAHRRHYV